MYVEETMDKQILYRYKKLFTGRITGRNKKKVSLNLNVRPREKKFPVEYNWKKIEKFLKKKILLIYQENNRRFGVLNLRKSNKIVTKK